ncbi:MAG: Bug family tripartite tricarboxylate transporter substrate binding protein [Burkholderiales bacterium]
MQKQVSSILMMGVVACAALFSFDSPAQTYPVKPIRLMIGFTAGSAPDSIARALAPTLNESLGQPIIVENRGGAGGSIATAALVKSPPDGYTISMMAAADTLQPALRKLPYDLERDIAPISLVVTGMAVLTVHPALPVRDVKELVALARANPAKMNYGSSGVGSSSHLMGALFNLLANTQIAHVPYKGSADSAIATAAGQIEISFPSVVAVGPLIDGKKLKALAVTGPKRAALLPSVPTLDEAGLKGYDRSTWFGVIAPAGVPRPVVTRLHSVIGAAVMSPEVKGLLAKQGLEPQTSTPEEFTAFIRAQIAQNAKIVKAAGLKTE